MKRTFFIASLLLFAACKNDIKETPSNTKTTEVSKDTLGINKLDTVQIEKKNILTSIDDDTPKLLPLVSSKTIHLNNDDYHIEINYPVLNEELDKRFNVFNQGIKRDFLNIEKLKNQILEDKELVCDTIANKRSKDKRFIDYKLYKRSNLISLVFLKENHYSGAMHYSYSFDCRNFDLDNFKFLSFEDVFKDKEQMLLLLNEHIRTNIKEGNIYYDCWELSPGDFDVFKNNFVITETEVMFYFDDCIICPSYTGTYFVTLSLESLKSQLR